MMKQKAPLLLGFSCAFVFACAHGVFPQSNYTVRRLTPDDGLGSVQVRGIVQDSLGFIWTGSRDVISRYDGYTFKTYDFKADTLGKVYIGGIVKMHTDRALNVWARSEVLSRYDRDTDKFIHYKPEVDLSKIRSSCFAADNRVVWFGMDDYGLVSFDTETNVTSHFHNHHRDSLTDVLRNSIWGISDQQDFLLLATLQGLWKFDKTKKVFTRPACDPKDTVLLYQKPILEMIDFPPYNSDDVWLSAEGKLINIDRKIGIKHAFEFPDGYPFLRDRQGIIWFHTKGGLYHYDPRQGSSGYLEEEVPMAKVANQLFVDKEQNIWLGTETSGLYQLVPKEIQFKNFKYDTPGTWSSGIVFQVKGNDHLALIRGDGKTNEVWSAGPILSADSASVGFHKVPIEPPLKGYIINAKMGRNKLWACSWGLGITSIPINPESGLIEGDKQRFFHADEKSPNAIRPFIGAVFEDGEENVWVASRGHGVSKLVNGKPYGDIGSVIHYVHNSADSNSVSHNYNWTFFPEGEKSFWVANWSGVDLFRNGKYEHIFKNLESVRSLLKISDNTLIIGTYNGIYEAVKRNNNYTIGPRLLSKSTAVQMTNDVKGRLWFIDYKHSRLVCYDRSEKVAMEFSGKDDLPDGVTYLDRTSEGIIVMGTASGLTLFDPLSLKISRDKTTPVLTGLKINNRDASIGESSSKGDGFFINTNINVSPELVLDYQHNNFAIEFSAMEMTSPDKNLYRRKLDGFDEDWIETDSKDRTAAYTNLDAGTYYFKVKTSNHHGIWSDSERTLKVRILPPPWKTWWAYSCYGLALVGVFVSWRRYDLKRVILKHRAEHLSELDNLKTRFFTNISHEFRTPITLIQGPLNEMYNNTTDERERSVIGMMLRNAKRLGRLINQLLDLSKLEAGQMILHATPVELVQFLREVASSYESLAKSKNIIYSFHSEVTELMVCLDADKMEKVVHNLLSNAFKFTRAGGEVTINLKMEGGKCIIQVKDTGIGIPADQLDKIFDRFYQVDSSQTREYEGSGLGMTLVKELVELHHGTVAVQSIVGEGTTFNLRLPIGMDQSKQTERIEGSKLRKAESFFDDTVLGKPDQKREKEETIESYDKPILLIVEDNTDMRNYIRKTFADQYQIMEAGNGKEGIIKADATVPDLIISDVMMPKMDGYKFCEYIKTHELTSHIPLILLTAKADRESKLTGLETGADDYLAKPFDADELKLIVKNRIEQRRRLRDRFSREIKLEPKQIAITSFDEKFLIKVLAIIEDHIGDETFSIDQLSREAGYSNMHFYRKIKALAGETPSQFLRTIRLKRAAEMLRKKSDNVTQIAYSVGFNSLPYFIKCFKDQFGVTPGQFAEQSAKPSF